MAKKNKKSNPYPDKKLDQLVSRVVRAETPYCVICGSPYNLNCGHYISRVVKSLRWHYLNVNTQCSSCNVKHEIDTVPYTLFMINKYGNGILDELEKIRYSIKKVTYEHREYWWDYWTERASKLEGI